MTQYAGNYIYEKVGDLDNTLKLFNQPEGYVEKTGGIYRYVYNYTDHLGNVRLSYKSGNQTEVARETVFSDDLGSSAGWDSNGAKYGYSGTVVNTFGKSGSTSGRLRTDAEGSYYAHSNTWIDIHNVEPVEYTFSGWMYISSTGSGSASSGTIFFFMNEDTETDYFTLTDYSEKVYTKDQWVHVQKTVRVPPTIDRINLRVGFYNGTPGAEVTAWFDDLKIERKGTRPKCEIVQERNYYPFGLEHKGYNSTIIGTENNYKQYQGQEWTEDLGLNIHEWEYRISDPAIGRFWQVDPLAEDYYHNGVYNFSENRVIDAWELEGLEARLIVEEGNAVKGNFGHTFVSVGSGKNQTVYTYGRWANTDASSGSIHSPLNNGPGVMVKLTGDDARAEIGKYVNDYDAQVFELTSVDESQVQSNLETEFNKSSETPEQGTYAGDDRAHVIDSYKLTSCNCTTKSLDAVESGNGNKPVSYKTTVSSPKLSSGNATVNMNIMSISPADLSKQLNDATKDSNSGVIDVTNNYKKDDK